MLGKDKDGLLQKDTVRAVYDGTLFWELEKQQKKCSLGIQATADIHIYADCFLFTKVDGLLLRICYGKW